MRRLAIIPLLAVGLLAGCSQVAQVAGDATGIDVGKTCSTVNSAYSQYKGLLSQAQTSEQQAREARDSVVDTLDGVADDVGGSLGNVIRSSAESLAQQTDLTAPETIEGIEQARDALQPFCD